MKRAGGPPNTGKPPASGSGGPSGAPQQPQKKPRFDDDFDGGMFEEPDFGDEEGMTYEKVDVETDDSEFASGKWIREREAIGWNPKEKPLMFHWLDIDMVSGPVLESNPSGGKMIGSLEGPVPVVRLYGVTQDGYSVMACIHGFTPYFYASVTGLPADLPDEALGSLRIALDNKIREKARGDEKNLKSFVLAIHKTEPMQSLVGYHADEKKVFIKVSVSHYHCQYLIRLMHQPSHSFTL